MAACLLGLLRPSGATAVEVRVDAPRVEATPGENVSVAFWVRGEPGALVAPTLRLPDGWTPLLDDEPFIPADDAGTVRIQMFQVPRYAPPGEFEVTYEVAQDGEAHSASATVTVGTYYGLTARVTALDEAVEAGAEAEFAWGIQNLGNTPREVDVAFRPRNLRAQVPARRLTVPPGESVDEIVVGKVGADDREAVLALEVIDAETGRRVADPIARLTVAVERGRVDRFRRLPTEVTLWNLTGTGDDNTPRTSFQGEITARGPLDEAKRVALDVRLRGPTVRSVPSATGYDSYLAELRADFDRIGGSVTLGDATHGVSWLTDPTSVSRGISAKGRLGMFEAGGRVAHPRFLPDAGWRLGGFFAVVPSDRVRLGVNTVWQRQPVQNDWVVSQEGLFRLLPPTGRPYLDLRYEVGLGAGLAPAAALDVRGGAETTRYWARGTWGSPGFSGAWAGRTLINAGVWQRFGPVDLQPSVEFDLRGSGATAQRAVIGAFQGVVLPRPDLRLQASWRYRDARFLEDADRFDVQQVASLGARWRGSKLAVGALAGFEDLRDEAWQGTALSGFGGLAVRGAVSGQFELGGGITVDSNHLRAPGTNWRFEPSVDLAWKGERRQVATLTYRVGFFTGKQARIRNQVMLRGRVVLPWGHALVWQGRAQLDSRDVGTQFILDTRLGYAVAFGIPLRRRTDLGVVTGTMFDAATGAPLADLPIELDGYRTHTDEEGNYEFDTTVRGQHLLVVPLHALEPGMAVLPRSQVAVGFEGDTEVPEVRHDFQVAMGGSLEIEVLLYETTKGTYVVDGEPEYEEVGPVTSAIVSLVRDDVVHKAYVDARGRASFHRLAAGTWTLLVDAAQLPPGVTVEDARRSVQIAPEEARSLTVRALPRVERIRFVDEPSPVTPVENEVVVREFRVVPASVVVGPNGEAEIRAELVFTDGRVESVADQSMWTSTNVDVATAGKGFVIGVAPGTATIDVQFDGLPVRSVAVEVVELPFVGLVIDPAEIALLPGGSTRLTARSIDVDGRFTDVSRKVEWVSEDPEVAVVGTDGTVFAKKEGKTRIRARSFGISAFPVEVTVAPNAYAPIEEPEITPPTP